MYVVISQTYVPFGVVDWFLGRIWFTSVDVWLLVVGGVVVVVVVPLDTVSGLIGSVDLS